MNKKTLSTRAIAYVALFIAMQLVLEVLFKVIPGQPQGGSITLSTLNKFSAVEHVPKMFTSATPLK